MSRYGESSDFCDDSGFRLRGSLRLIRRPRRSAACAILLHISVMVVTGRSVWIEAGASSHPRGSNRSSTLIRCTGAAEAQACGEHEAGKGLALGRWRGPARRTTRAVDLRSKSAASSMAYESSCAFRRSRIPSVLLQQWHCHAARLNRCESSPVCMRSSRWRAYGAPPGVHLRRHEVFSNFGCLVLVDNAGPEAVPHV
jgi:hypothetical protein